MESLNSEFFNRKNPEEPGVSESTEKKKDKKKKKTTKTPLPVKREVLTQKDKKLKSETKQPKADKVEGSEVVQVPESTEKRKSVLPELDTDEYRAEATEADKSRLEEGNKSEETEYLGELIIDHSDHGTEQGSVDTPSAEAVNENTGNLGVAQEGVVAPEGLGVASNEARDSLAQSSAVTEGGKAYEATPWSDSYTQNTYNSQPLNSQESEAAVNFGQEGDPGVNRNEPELGAVPYFAPEISSGNMVNPSLYEQSDLQPTQQPEEDRRIEEAPRRRQDGGQSSGLALFSMDWLFRRRKQNRLNSKFKEEIAHNKGQIEDLESDLSTQMAISKDRLSLVDKVEQKLQAISRRVDRLWAERGASSSERESIKNVNPETLTASELSKNSKPENISEILESMPEKATRSEETFSKPEADNRVEMSAWHRIELDKKTGRLAESRNLEYGKEFVNEQSQERLARGAGVAHSAVQVGSAVFSDPDKTPSGTSAARSVRTTSVHGGPVSVQYISNQIVRNTTNPMIWLWALIVVFILFSLGILS